MTDNWLEEIEARANVSRPGPYYPADIFHLTAEDMDWLKQRPVTNADVHRLIAEVSALRAQAAAQRGVVEAAREYWTALDAYTAHSLTDDMPEYEGELDEAERIARAALAALEGEE